MISITCRSWSRPAHGGQQREEQDWIVSLNGVQLAVYSTYSTDCRPQGDPQLRAAAFASTLVQALLPTWKNVQALFDYHEGSEPYNEAAEALRLFIAQIDREEEHAVDRSSVVE